MDPQRTPDEQKELKTKYLRLLKWRCIFDENAWMFVEEEKLEILKIFTKKQIKDYLSADGENMSAGAKEAFSDLLNGYISE